MLKGSSVLILVVLVGSTVVVVALAVSRRRARQRRQAERKRRLLGIPDPVHPSSNTITISSAVSLRSRSLSLPGVRRRFTQTWTTLFPPLALTPVEADSSSSTSSSAQTSKAEESSMTAKKRNGPSRLPSASASSPQAASPSSPLHTLTTLASPPLPTPPTGVLSPTSASKKASARSTSGGGKSSRKASTSKPKTSLPGVRSIGIQVPSPTPSDVEEETVKRSERRLSITKEHESEAGGQNPTSTSKGATQPPAASTPSKRTPTSAAISSLFSSPLPISRKALPPSTSPQDARDVVPHPNGVAADSGDKPKSPDTSSSPELHSSPSFSTSSETPSRPGRKGRRASSRQHSQVAVPGLTPSVSISTEQLRPSQASTVSASPTTPIAAAPVSESPQTYHGPHLAGLEIADKEGHDSNSGSSSSSSRGPSMPASTHISQSNSRDHSISGRSAAYSVSTSDTAATSFDHLDVGQESPGRMDADRSSSINGRQDHPPATEPYCFHSSFRAEAEQARPEPKRGAHQRQQSYSAARKQREGSLPTPPDSEPRRRSAQQRSQHASPLDARFGSMQLPSLALRQPPSPYLHSPNQAMLAQHQQQYLSMLQQQQRQQQAVQQQQQVREQQQQQQQQQQQYGYIVQKAYQEAFAGAMQQQQRMAQQAGAMPPTGYGMQFSASSSRGASPATAAPPLLVAGQISRPASPLTFPSLSPSPARGAEGANGGMLPGSHQLSQAGVPAAQPLEILHSMQELQSQLQSAHAGVMLPQMAPAFGNGQRTIPPSPSLSPSPGLGSMGWSHPPSPSVHGGQPSPALVGAVHMLYQPVPSPATSQMSLLNTSAYPPGDYAQHQSVSAPPTGWLHAPTLVPQQHASMSGTPAYGSPVHPAGSQGPLDLRQSTGRLRQDTLGDLDWSSKAHSTRRTSRSGQADASDGGDLRGSDDAELSLASPQARRPSFGGARGRRQSLAPPTSSSATPTKKQPHADFPHDRSITPNLETLEAMKDREDDTLTASEILTKMKAMEAVLERRGKELELANWRVKCGDVDRLNMETEHQKALNHFYERAERAEARLKLADEGGGRPMNGGSSPSLPARGIDDQPTSSEASTDGVDESDDGNDERRRGERRPSGSTSNGTPSLAEFQSPMMASYSSYMVSPSLDTPLRHPPHPFKQSKKGRRAKRSEPTPSDPFSTNRFGSRHSEVSSDAGHDSSDSDDLEIVLSRSRSPSLGPVVPNDRVPALPSLSEPASSVVGLGVVMASSDADISHESVLPANYVGSIPSFSFSRPPTSPTPLELVQNPLDAHSPDGH